MLEQRTTLASIEGCRVEVAAAVAGAAAAAAGAGARATELSTTQTIHKNLPNWSIQM